MSLKLLITCSALILFSSLFLAADCGRVRHVAGELRHRPPSQASLRKPELSLAMEPQHPQQSSSQDFLLQAGSGGHAERHALLPDSPLSGPKPARLSSSMSSVSGIAGMVNTGLDWGSNSVIGVDIGGLPPVLETAGSKQADNLQILEARVEQETGKSLAQTTDEFVAGFGEAGRAMGIFSELLMAPVPPSSQDPSHRAAIPGQGLFAAARSIRCEEEEGVPASGGATFPF